MKLWLKYAMGLSILLFIGCGATYQSESARKPRITNRGNPYFDQGNVFLKKQMYHEAIEQYQQALRIDPDAAIIHAALGWAYYNVGMLDAAIAEGEEVMRLEPDNPDIPKLMELLYQERRRRR